MGILSTIFKTWDDIFRVYIMNKCLIYTYYNKYRDHNVTDTMEEKKPFTRLRYADHVKIVYNGIEEQDTVGIRRFRYR